MTKRDQLSTNLLSKPKEKKKEPQSERSADCGSGAISLYLKDRTFSKDLVQSTRHPPGMLSCVNQKAVP